MGWSWELLGEMTLSVLPICCSLSTPQLQARRLLVVVELVEPARQIPYIAAVSRGILPGKSFALSPPFGGLNPKACPVEQREAMGCIELTIALFTLLKELS
jgi:hypothetical protein